MVLEVTQQPSPSLHLSIPPSLIPSILSLLLLLLLLFIRLFRGGEGRGMVCGASTTVLHGRSSCRRRGSVRRDCATDKIL
eukprot:1185747-Pyramimonas_sp.AAC.1